MQGERDKIVPAKRGEEISLHTHEVGERFPKSGCKKLVFENNSLPKLNKKTPVATNARKRFLMWLLGLMGIISEFATNHSDCLKSASENCRRAAEWGRESDKECSNRKALLHSSQKRRIRTKKHSVGSPWERNISCIRAGGCDSPGDANGEFPFDQREFAPSEVNHAIAS